MPQLCGVGRDALRDDQADRLAAVEAQQQRLLDLLERLVPALERLAATTPAASAPLRLVR